jgi:hypothetical protein
MRPFLSALALGLCLCAVGPRSARAQASDAEVRADIAFARGLAGERGTADLFERVLAALEPARLAPPLREELALAKAEIYFEAAHHDATRRTELLTKSMDAYRAFTSMTRDAQARAAAEAGLALVWSYHAHDLARRLDGASRADAATLRPELSAVLRATVAKTAELAAAIESKPRANRSDAEQRRWCELTFTRADMSRELGRVEDDGARLDQAAQILDQLADAAGFGTPWCVRAWIGAGQVACVRGEYRAAADLLERAVEFAILRDGAHWSGLSADMTRDEKRSRFVLAEAAMADLLRALDDAGRTPEAIAWGLHFWNVSRRERLEFGDPDGYLALLEIARCAATAGGFVGGDLDAGQGAWSASGTGSERTALGFAVALAAQVTEFGAGGELGARGQELLSELVARPGAAVEPSAWAAALQSDFDDGRDPDRLSALQRVAAALESAQPATRAAFVPRALGRIGQGFRKRGRDLEAALCFEAALDRWRGAPEVDRANARGLLDACDALAHGDATLDALSEKARRIAAEVGGAAGSKLNFERAESAFAEGRWAAAKALFERVDEACEECEKARVFAGACAFELGALDEARGVFADYLARFVAGPEQRTVDARKLARRAEAAAAAVYYSGALEFQAAESPAGDWRRVTALLDDYDKRFPTQTSLAPAAVYRAVAAHARLGEFEPMRAQLATLATRFPASAFTAQAALAAHDALAIACDAATDGPAKTALRREMALDLRTVDAATPAPNFDVLRRESKLWLACGDPAAAEEVLRRIAQWFVGDAEHERVVQFVLPDLGRALLAQRKSQAAAEVLKPLVEGGTATRESAHDYARALAGWVECSVESDGAAGAIVEVPGVGGAASFATALDLFERLIASSSARDTSEGYALEFDALYARRQYARIDRRQLAPARQELAALRDQLGPDFAHAGVPADLRRKFAWLAEALQ